MPKRKLFLQLDPWLLICAVLAFLIGLVAIGSSAQSLGSNRFVIVQAAAFFIGFVLLLLLTRADYDMFGQLGVYIYIVSALMLALVLFVGTGALMSPTALQQGMTIPSIAHLVRLSVSKTN